MTWQDSLGLRLLTCRITLPSGATGGSRCCSEFRGQCELPQEIEAGVAKRPWSMEDIVKLLDKEAR